MIRWFLCRIKSVIYKRWKEGVAVGNLTLLPFAPKGCLGAVVKRKGDTQGYSVPSY